MEEYAGRVLADRYRLPRMAVGDEPPESPAFDTYSGQEVLVRQVPLPEVVSAEMVFASGEEPPDVLAPGDDPGQRALRAAVAGARIPDHPGLVQVYDVFLDGGGLWIVSEWVPARPLSEVIEEGPLTPYRAAEIGADVLAALRAVHAEGWTHRNVTAESVLLCDDGRAMLGGLCAAAAEEALCGNDPVPDPTRPPPPPADFAEPQGFGEPGEFGAPGEFGTEPEFDEAYDEERSAEEPEPLPRRLPDRLPDAFRGAFPEADTGEFLPELSLSRELFSAGDRDDPDDDGYPDDGYGPDPFPRPYQEDDDQDDDGHPHHPRGFTEPPPPRRPAPEPAWEPRPNPVRERARQARLGLIGPVTERWAPEQAGPLPGDDGTPRHFAEGPPSDMWALGALLFRVVQGHPPFPEASVVELVEIVRHEPPAYAEDCGPLRSVVESLLRKNPQERPGAEQVRGWLRSLIRTAPEPEVGQEPAPPPADPGKIVEVRRRGEVARRRRTEKALVHKGRHARGKGGERPRRLGAVLVGLVVLVVVGMLGFAALFLPDEGGGQRQSNVGGPPDDGGAPASPSAEPSTPEEEPTDAPSDPPDQSTSRPPDLSSGFATHTDPMGFTLALHQDLQVKGETNEGQMWFTDGDDVEMVVVPGRDTAEDFGDDVAGYQKIGEPELKRFRNADWSASSNLSTFQVRGNPAAQGEFTWMEGHREYFGRNFVMLQDGRYHVVLVYGPDRDREDVSRFFEKAAESYQFTK